MINGIQIILLIGIGILAFRTVLRAKERQISSIAFVGWMFLWVVGAIIVAVPETTSKIADLVGVGRGVDVAVYLALVLIFYLLFKMYNRTLGLERDITRLVRALALKESEDEDRS